MIKLPEDLNDKSFGFIADKFQCSPLQAQFILVGFNYTITEVKRLNATAQPVSDGWVKCGDMMPSKGERVFVFIGFNSDSAPPSIHDAEFTGQKFRRGGATIKPYPLEDGFGVTHWMPLPAAPGGQDD